MLKRRKTVPVHQLLVFSHGLILFLGARWFQWLVPWGMAFGKFPQHGSGAGRKRPWPLWKAGRHHCNSQQTEKPAKPGPKGNTAIQKPSKNGVGPGLPRFDCHTFLVRPGDGQVFGVVLLVLSALFMGTLLMGFVALAKRRRFGRSFYRYAFWRFWTWIFVFLVFCC